MAIKVNIFILYAAVFAYVDGYSTGAPVQVCKDMKPKHPYEPQTSIFPYQVTVDKDEIKAGDKIKISITGSTPFKGFLVQVRAAGSDDAVGTLSIDETFGKTISCGNSNAATHKNDSLKSGVTLEWTAPTEPLGVYTVFVTVAQDGATFWVKQKTTKITVT